MQGVELVAQRRNLRPIDRRRRREIQRGDRAAAEPLSQREKPPLGVLHRVHQLRRCEDLDTIFPQCFECPHGSGIVHRLEEAAQTLSFRAAILRIGGIVDVDVELLLEELRKTRIGEVEDAALAPDEIDEFIDEAQVDRADRADCPTSQRRRPSARNHASTWP